MGWRNFQRRVDVYVNRAFSERIELHPMLGGEFATGSAQPDPARAVLYCRGVYVMPGSRTTGEAGSVATGLARSEGNVLTSMEWVSITEDQLGDPGSWQAYDRVYLPERGTWHQINSVTPSTTGRFNIQLTRVQEGSP